MDHLDVATWQIKETFEQSLILRWDEQALPSSAFIDDQD